MLHDFRSRVARLAAIAWAALLLACCAGWAQAPTRPQAAAPAPHRVTFRAVSYEIFASLFPENQTISARAIVEFESQELSRTVECELHPNLRISAVRDASGKLLDSDRDYANPLFVRVSLPDSIAAGQKTKLTFEYAGPLANEENSPVAGVRLASIGKEGAYLLLPARWFPVTDYPANRYTAIFHMEVPQDFAVVGTGNAQAPAPVTSTPVISVTSTATAGVPVLRNRNSPVAPASAPAFGKNDATPAPASAPTTGRIAYTFRVERPEAAGTFVAGSLQLYPVQAEGMNVSVYARPSDGGTAPAYGGAVARIVGAFSDQFGPLSQPNLTVAQIPDGTLSSYAAPGLLLISRRQWAANPNSRLLSNLIAQQWWGNQVLPASPSDVWLSDGLARYSEALYVEQTAGKEGMNKALDDFAIGALMFEEGSPIAEAGRLTSFTPNYNSVVVNKGAMVFHMLREQLGDDAFFALLRDFYKQFAGKAASLDNFEKMAEDRADKLAPAASGTFALGNASPSGTSSPSAAPAAPSTPGSAGPVNLRPFFAQWINSTGVPEFNITYTIFRTKTGFRLSGRVKQNLDFFNMPVEIEVLTEGNPEFKTVQVSGTDSSFDFEVFGRPRPNGVILDPHNYILKSSPALRVRGIIARGEALAEQGRYYDAIQQYSQALDQQRNNALAEFRMGEAFFYQKNYSASANAFRDALDGDIDPSFKWVEVWSHLYLGKIYDTAGDRARAVNEYSKAEQTNDDTGGAQAEAKKYLAQPYKEGA